MPGVAIVTDTDSSLPLKVASDYGIYQVPINVQFGDETFSAVEDLDDDKLFERVDREGALPTTSAPSPGRFAEAYQRAFDAGAEEVVCFTVSSKVSAVYNAAVSAVDLVDNKSVQVVDTASLSMGQGYIALAGAQAANTGASSQEVIETALETGKRIHLFAALSTLKYLAMSGRVGYLAAGIANLFDVRPILSIQDGKLDLLERIRTERKAWDRLIDLVEKTLDGRNIEKMSIIHVTAPDQAVRFHQKLSTAVDCPEEFLTAELTPGLSVHTGSGVIGVVFVTEH